MWLSSSCRVEEAGCKIYSGAPTVSQTTGQIRHEEERSNDTSGGSNRRRNSSSDSRAKE